MSKYSIIGGFLAILVIFSLVLLTDNKFELLIATTIVLLGAISIIVLVILYSMRRNKVMIK